MKNSYTFLTIATLALFLFSCEKETVVPTQTADTPQNVQQQLDNLGAPAILFQYASTDLETGEERGWLIDRSGHVRSYQRTVDSGPPTSMETETWTPSELSDLRARAAETVVALEPADVLIRVRQGMTLSEIGLSSVEVNNQATTQTGFYAFTAQATDAGDGCYGNQHNDRPRGTDEEMVSRQVIHLSGYVTRHETSGNGVALYKWLSELNEGF